MTDHPHAPREIRLRWLILGACGALVVLLAALCWVGVRALLAERELKAVAPLAQQLRTQLDEQDTAALRTTSGDVGGHAARAATLTGDPIWRATELLPALGPNLTAARVASAQLDALANQVLSPLLSVASSLGSGGSSGGPLDLPAIQKAAPALATAERAAQGARSQLQSVSLAGVIPALADGVVQLRTITGQIEPTVTSIAGFARLAPSLLGSDGPRTILVVLQNNAELRTAGGISGEFALLTADKGRLTLDTVSSDAGFPIRDTPIAPVPASTTTLYGDVVGRFVQNTTMPADFSLTAKLATAWWTTYKKVTPDAVLAIDPGVLQAVLTVIGPVSLPGGVELTAENMWRTLLVEPYLTLDGAQQDELFAAATTAIFGRLNSGDVSFVKLLQALATPAGQGRVSLWSSRADEQRIIAQGMLGGPSVRQRLAGADTFAVYFNDATGAKMDSFLQTTIASGTAQCRSDGRRDIVVTVTIHSAAPADAASLPGTLTGWGVSGTPPGDISTDVAVSAPAGSYLGAVTVDGTQVLSANATDAGFPVSLVRSRLSPGQTATIAFRFYAAERGPLTPRIIHTPMFNDPQVRTEKVACG